MVRCRLSSAASATEIGPTAHVRCGSIVALKASIRSEPPSSKSISGNPFRVVSEYEQEVESAADLLRAHGSAPRSATVTPHALSSTAHSGLP